MCERHMRWCSIMAWWCSIMAGWCSIMAGWCSIMAGWCSIMAGWCSITAWWCSITKVVFHHGRVVFHHGSMVVCVSVLCVSEYVCVWVCLNVCVCVCWEVQLDWLYQIVVTPLHHCQQCVQFVRTTALPWVCSAILFIHSFIYCLFCT